MEVPTPGVQLELSLTAYTTATTMQDLSHICNLHHSSWQRQISNPLSKARDRTCILMVASRIRFCCATMGTPTCMTFKRIIYPPPKNKINKRIAYPGELILGIKKKGRKEGRNPSTWSSHLKKEAECILLLTCEMDRQALNEDPLSIFHNGHWCDWGSNIGQSGQEIKQALIIDFQVGNTHSDGMCGSFFDHLKNLGGRLDSSHREQNSNNQPALGERSP